MFLPEAIEISVYPLLFLVFPVSLRLGLNQKLKVHNHVPAGGNINIYINPTLFPQSFSKRNHDFAGGTQNLKLTPIITSIINNIVFIILSYVIFFSFIFFQSYTFILNFIYYFYYFYYYFHITQKKCVI